ncbi:glycosyl transferase family protein [Gloeomargarita lithophora Alchichica-D10]|uniref:Glycosyl transferase family protein n=1 Tax=Gloeomargarita lithophora Alchichica-D10 TaxID=1188229 RepID=A0A1J0AGU5_9CYAN|nr:glycosyltransferase family 2 protein [Gloeomargarita lithophora]APB35149.1 glycosyl transferase family protein [Gloeomargarita lithophora Alchichica-D10]
MVLVTVGIPCYNEEKYIGRAIESVVNQTLQDIEIIISDNCSIDATDKIIRTYSKDDSRIAYHRQPRQITAKENFWTLLQKCQTKYFTWLAADDFFHLEWLGVAVNFLEANPDVIMAYSKIDMVDDNMKIQNYPLTGFLDTTQLEPKTALREAMIKRRCVSDGAYGLYRTDILRSVVCPNIWCGDQIMMSHVHSKGAVKLFDQVYLIRTFRDGSHDQATQKEKRWGIILFRAMDALLVDILKKLYEIRFVSFHPQLSLSDKFTLTGELIVDLYQIRKDKAMSYLYQKYPSLYKVAHYLEGMPTRLQRRWQKVMNSDQKMT